MIRVTTRDGRQRPRGRSPSYRSRPPRLEHHQRAAIASSGQTADARHHEKRRQVALPPSGCRSATAYFFAFSIASLLESSPDLTASLTSFFTSARTLLGLRGRGGTGIALAAGALAGGLHLGAGLVGLAAGACAGLALGVRPSWPQPCLRPSRRRASCRRQQRRRERRRRRAPQRSTTISSESYLSPYGGASAHSRASQNHCSTYHPGHVDETQAPGAPAPGEHSTSPT